MVSGVVIENHKRNRHVMVENYFDQLEHGSEAFWISHKNVQDAIEWCEDNFDDDCWFFDEGLSADCYFIKGYENIMAFKLRWS